MRLTSLALAAPADAATALALAGGSMLRLLQQFQRTGFVMWNGVESRTETRRIGGLPFVGGAVLGCVISREGVEVRGFELNGLRPTFYLLPQGSPRRDAVAVFALNLRAFHAPANR